MAITTSSVIIFDFASDLVSLAQIGANSLDVEANCAH